MSGGLLATGAGGLPLSLRPRAARMIDQDLREEEEETAAATERPTRLRNNNNSNARLKREEKKTTNFRRTLLFNATKINCFLIDRLRRSNSFFFFIYFRK